MKSVLLCFGIFLVLLLPASCGRSGGGNLPTLSVGHVGHDHQLALGAAALKPGVMEKACGIHLKEEKPREVYLMVKGGKPEARIFIRKVGGGSRMPAAMERGEIEVGLGGIAAEIFAYDRGDPVKVICPLNVDGDFLLVRPDFPGKDWKGFVRAVRRSPRPVKIGYKAPMAVAKLIFERACDAEGIPRAPSGEGKPGGVELVNLQGAANTIPTLKSGAVDGVVINEPVASNAVFRKAARAVCPLSDLPPRGEWVSHPCCSICATERAITEKRPLLTDFLRLITAATRWMNGHKEEAARVAHQWTRAPLEVEEMSVPGITYIREAGPAYRKGLYRWFTMMGKLGKFQGRLEGLSPEKAFRATHDLSLLREVLGR